MNPEEEILESFLADAGDWGDKFLSLALEIVDTVTPHTTIGEVFRGVHSLKGGASFIAADDDRMTVLTEFCHDFESYLDAMRKGNLEINEGNRELVARALNTLCDDISLLQKGERIRRHDGLLEKFKESMYGTVVIRERDNVIIFQIVKDLNHPKDAESFNKVMWQRLRATAPDTRVVFDLCGEYRLCSMAIGSIIGALGSVAAISIVKPPPYMKLVFRRFRFEEFGIRIHESLEECVQ